MAVTENRANAALSKRTDRSPALAHGIVFWAGRVERDGNPDLGMCQLLSLWYGSCAVHPPSPSSSVSPSLIESIVEEQCLNSVQTFFWPGRR